MVLLLLLYLNILLFFNLIHIPKSIHHHRHPPPPHCCHPLMVMVNKQVKKNGSLVMFLLIMIFQQSILVTFHSPALTINPILRPHLVRFLQEGQPQHHVGVDLMKGIVIVMHIRCSMLVRDYSIDQFILDINDI